MDVRDWRQPDLDRLAAINAATMPRGTAVSVAELEQLLRDASHALVAETSDGIVGFLVCLTSDRDRDDPAFEWFRLRHSRFAFIDRVGVDPATQSRGVGAALYDELELRLRGTCPVITCAVEGEGGVASSAFRFHRRRGFYEVRRLDESGRNPAAILMEKPLPVGG